MATVYTAWVDSNRVYFNKSTDDGETFGTPATIDDGNVAGYTRHSPKIQVDADGDVYVCWLRKKTFGDMAEVLVINHTADGGAAWSGTYDISDVPGADMTEYLGFIIDAAGYLWVLFGRQNWSPGVWYYKSTNIKDYDTWDNEVYITHSLQPTSQIDVCEDENGWLWIVYINGGDIRCHRYDARWVREADVEAAGTLSYPEVFSEAHHVHCSYYVDGTGARIRRRSGDAWEAAVTIADEQWPSIGGCELWAATVGTTASMEVNQRDSEDAGATWGAASEKSHGEGDEENITGGKGVNLAHTPYYIFVTASHKIFCCKGSATE